MNLPYTIPTIKIFSCGYQVPYVRKENRYYFVVVRTLSQMEVVK